MQNVCPSICYAHSKEDDHDLWKVEFRRMILYKSLTIDNTKLETIL